MLTRISQIRDQTLSSRFHRHFTGGFWAYVFHLPSVWAPPLKGEFDGLIDFTMYQFPLAALTRLSEVFTFFNRFTHRVLVPDQVFFYQLAEE